MEGLNNCYTLFFDSITFDGDLRINVIEGRKSKSPESLEICGKELGLVHKLQPESDSSEFTISFQRPVVWQVIDESYSIYNDEEEFDLKGLFSIISKSRYLEYVNQTHGLYKDCIGPGKLYRVWTEDQVIEVVAVDEPTISKN